MLLRSLISIGQELSETHKEKTTGVQDEHLTHTTRPEKREDTLEPGHRVSLSYLGHTC